MSDAPVIPEAIPGPSWQSLGVIVTVIVGAGGIVTTFVLRLWARLAAMDKSHADFRVEVAKTYVTNQAVVQIEERLVKAIEKLGDRLERALESRAARRMQPDPD